MSCIRFLDDHGISYRLYRHDQTFDAQHMAHSAVPSQSLDAIHWSMLVDTNRQYSGNELLIHYGSPIVTAANTILVLGWTWMSGQPPRGPYVHPNALGYLAIASAFARVIAVTQ